MRGRVVSDGSKVGKRSGRRPCAASTGKAVLRPDLCYLPQVLLRLRIVGIVAGCALATTAACTEGTDLNSETGDGETGEPEDPYRATVTHSFGKLHLEGFEEAQPCGSWTLNNDEAVYVNAVTLANEGSWHHSNWFVVPETMYPGEDGYWKCSDRDFEEIKSATSGTVIFAQSTQSLYETMDLNPGAVVKIPPRHKIVGGLHALNLAPRELETELRMSIEIIHPKDVETVLTPIRLSYLDLTIPPLAESHFSSSCDMNARYEQATGHPLDVKLHYVIPHYHYLGNFFELSINGGPRDGELLYQLDGFNAEGNGRQFFPPIDLTGAKGLNFTCGYDNWRDVEVGWGVGDQEMCVMLGLAESERLMDNTVLEGGSEAVGVVDGVVQYEGGCLTIPLTKKTNQGPPTQEEIDGDLYVPPSDPNDDGLLPIPECEDTPEDATAAIEASLTAIKENIFVPACAFSACHGQGGEASGLDLDSTNLHDTLLNHPVDADTTMPLIDPGNPGNSWIMKLIGTCEPTTETGDVANHMPRNAPTLLDPGLVAAVRDWIAAGAPDN